MNIPQLTTNPRTGLVRCGWKATATAPPCGAPAEWHIAWSLTPGNASFSLLCADHMEAAKWLFVYADRHLARADCDMPSTGWWTSDTPPSLCVIVTTDNVGRAS
ncbi:hypothetical protein [Streptomyces sp. SID8352]|uniref:hypothetical protein n=1 Tax=Streptomyces sp. SID8352 TaxID=2690338 RepID=UPI00136FE7DD|nr:hypothetical protein [Streptomyces sp. SID8352]MYU24500.1 hypothetical protein [Streptomyces sp. SID8352]